jgi:hypothetical protein
MEMTYSKTNYEANKTTITAVAMNNIEGAVALLDEKLSNLDSETLNKITTNSNNDFIFNQVTMVKKTDFDTLVEKLDDVINPMVVTLTLDKSLVELGSTVNSVVVNWTCSKSPTSQTLDAVTIDPTLRTKTYSAPLTTNKTFTYVATTKLGAQITATTTLSFRNGIYYGVSDSVSYDSALISSLTNKVLSDTRGRTIAVSADVGKFVYYCVPTRLGTCAFSIAGVGGGFTKVGSAIPFTNPSGLTENYDIWKSDKSGLGNVSVVVS